MVFRRIVVGLAAGVVMMATGVGAEEVTIVSGAVGTDLQELQAQSQVFTDKTGHTVKIVSMPASTTDQFGQYRLWLSAGNPDIDVYRTDVIWAPQLAAHFVDLSQALAAEIPKHFPSIIESQTVDGKLVAAPMFTDAPALYYRKDLLEKYGKQPPKTWAELAATGKEIQDGERAAGAADVWGYVFQGAAYEGLTCDALEWVMSFGGGQIVEADGTISVKNPNAVKALETAKSWIGTISPPGVLAYKEEDSRGVFQTGKAVYMRNWAYAYALGNGDDSAVKGKFDVVPLPMGEGGTRSAATLGGWNLAVSKYSPRQEAAIALVSYLSSEEAQRYRAIQNSKLPTLQSLYSDPEVAEKQPVIATWKDVFLNAVPRPSAPTKASYNEVSSEFWTAAANTLAGNGSADQNLAKLEGRLKRLKGSGWK